MRWVSVWEGDAMPHLWPPKEGRFPGGALAVLRAQLSATIDLGRNDQ